MALVGDDHYLGMMRESIIFGEEDQFTKQTKKMLPGQGNFNRKETTLLMYKT